MKHIDLICFILLLGQFSSATPKLESIELDWSKSVPQMRWMSEGDQFKVTDLLKIKLEVSKENFDSCLALIPAAKKKYPSLGPWLVLQELQCFKNKRSKNIDEIKGVLGHGEGALKELGPWQEELLKLYTTVYIDLLSHEQKSLSAWALDEISTREDLFRKLSSDQKAAFYEALGDQPFAEKDWQKALFLYKQSLEAARRSPVLAKLNQVMGKLEATDSEKESKGGSKAVEAEKLLKQSYKHLGEANYIEAAKSALMFLEKFPGSPDVNEAQRVVFRSYQRSSKASEQETIIKKMGQAPYEYVWDWAESLSAKSDYEPAARLSGEILARADSLHYKGDDWLMYGKRLHWSGDYKEAIKVFQKVAKQSPDSQLYFEAYFQEAISHLRLSDWTAAKDAFKKIIDSESSLAEPFQMTSLYWSYRISQRLKEDDKQQKFYADQLLDQAPFTYYSLMIQAERNQAKLKWPVESEKELNLKSTIYLLPLQLKAWKRVELLLASGWYEEAWAELQFMPEPMTAEQKVLFARYLASAMAYPPAMRLLNQAWDEDQSFRSKKVVGLAYPSEFEKEIGEASEEQKLSPLLIRSLIRQESGFFVSALSRSNAIGLMQLIPLTAREVLGWMGLEKKYRVPEDVFRPGLNIRMGTKYLSHVAKRVNGHIPIALASYNAGPTRIKRWLHSRKETKELANKTVWEPIDDLWLDELPWGEPRFYVKAILRNVMMYQMLEDKKDQKLKSPVWKDFYGKSN